MSVNMYKDSSFIFLSQFLQKEMTIHHKHSVSDGGHLTFLHKRGSYNVFHASHQYNNGSIRFLMSEYIQKDTLFMFLCQLLTKL
jgi:hypothetical protein